MQVITLVSIDSQIRMVGIKASIFPKLYYPLCLELVNDIVLGGYVLLYNNN